MTRLIEVREELQGRPASKGSRVLETTVVARTNTITNIISSTASLIVCFEDNVICHEDSVVVK